MNRRGLDAVQPGSVKKNGKVIKAFLYAEDLVIDVFDNKVYTGRYVIDKEGHHMMNDGSKWRKAKLYRLLGFQYDPGYSYWSKDVDEKNIKADSKEEKELVEEFAADMESYFCYLNWLEKIERLESRCDEKVRKRAYERKCERIDAMFAKMPPIPADFNDWIKKSIFEGREYLFYDKQKERYYCTACKKYHHFKKTKEREILTCSRTGQQVTVEKRKADLIEGKARVMLPQVIDADTVVYRHMEVVRQWSTHDFTEVEKYENVRLLYRRDLGKLQIFYGQYSKQEPNSQAWWDTNGRNKRPDGKYCYPNGVKESVIGTIYDGCGIELMAQKGWSINYNGIMKNQSHYFEYLAKANMKKLAEDISRAVSVYNGFYSPKCELNEYGRTATEVLKINMQRFHRLKQMNGGICALGWLQYEEATGEKVSQEVMEWMDKNEINPKDIKFISDKMSPTKIMNYVKRQADENKKTPKSILGTWEDYLSMAKKLDFDVNDEIIYRCRKLIQRHDECVKELNDRADDKMIAEMEKRYPKVKGIYKRIREKYEYQDDTYQVVVPAGVRDIVMEGRALHHCVASSERYFDRIQSEETYIFFLRKVDRPLKAYYTLEVEPGGTVRQKRTEFDRQEKDIKQAEQFLKKWQQEIKKNLKEEDKCLAKKSKKLRIEGLEELKKNRKVIPAGELAGKLLVDVLKDDLMEAM